MQGPAVPLLGDNYRSFLRLETSTEMVRNIYNRNKNDRYTGLYQGTHPVLMLRDPELIKQITVKDFDHFVDHRSFVSENQDPIFSKNLFSLKGDKWRDMRATLSPTFTSSKMRSMYALMEKSAQQYVNFYLEQKKDSLDIELKDSFTRFANDVIANCAFGVSVDSLKDPTNEFYTRGKDLSDFSGFVRNLKFLINLISPRLTDFLKVSLFPKTDFFKYLVRDAVRMREEKNIHRPDMINLLMEARKGKLKYEEAAEQKTSGFATVEESEIGKKQVKKTEMTEDVMAAQVVIFFLAGFDTISTMMSFLCYELAVHPEIQKKLIEEIDATRKANKGGLTYDELNKMKYMDMVITESMRKNPPVIAIDRVCTKAYTIKPERPGEVPVHLKPGDMVWLPMTGIHHNEEYFPNPSKFDPERFSDENKSSINPYAYIPFGSGPRNCIGSRFALMECKTLIFHILSKFELTVIKKTTIPMKLAKGNFNPFIEGGFWVGFQRRKNVTNY